MMANNENILTVKISRSTVYFVCNVIHNSIVQQYNYGSVVASIYCTLATVTNTVMSCKATVLQYSATVVLFSDAATVWSATTITVAVCFYKQKIAIAL